jgi:hypothetical protein
VGLDGVRKIDSAPHRRFLTTTFAACGCTGSLDPVARIAGSNCDNGSRNVFVAASGLTGGVRSTAAHYNGAMILQYPAFDGAVLAVLGLICIWRSFRPPPKRIADNSEKLERYSRSNRGSVPFSSSLG